MGLEIREDIVSAWKHMGEHDADLHGVGLWLGDVTCSYSPSRESIDAVYSHWGYDWLRLTYVYEPESRHQGHFPFSGNKVRLHRASNLDPAEAANHCLDCNPRT
jgi:hypothetical protein